MRKAIYNKRGVAQGVPFIFKMTSKAVNTGTETVTINSDYTLVKEIKGSGFAKEQTDYIMSGTVAFNKATTIATLKIETTENYYFPSSPYLETKFRNNIKLLLTKIDKNSDRTNRNITAYTFSVIYQSKEATTRPSGLFAELKYNSRPVTVRTPTIHHISFGPTTIPEGGAFRPIKVIGTPSATFGIAINENFLDATGTINKHNDTSILSTSNANSTVTYNYGKTMNVIKETLDSTGMFKFNQRFPQSVFHKRVNGAVSASSTINLDDVEDLAVGDSFKIGGSANSLGYESSGLSRITIQSIDTTNKRVVVKTPVTIADNSWVYFTRKRSYSIDVIPDLTSTFSNKIPTVDPTYRLNQYVKTLVRFQLFTAGTTFTITQLNDVDTSLSAGAEHYHYLTGIANRNRLVPFSLKYKLVAASDGFNTIRHPIFNSFVAHDGTGTSSAAQSNGGSDWTNSVFSTNGGTHIVSQGAKYTLSTASVTNDTCHLLFRGWIRKFGTEDVDLKLDLDKVLTVSA